MKYRVTLFTKIEYNRISQQVNVYGKKLNRFFNRGVFEHYNKVSIPVKDIRNTLFIKPSFTKGYFEIHYIYNKRDRWFQVPLSKSFWYGAEQIFEELKRFKHIKSKNYFSKTAWKKQELNLRKRGEG